MTITLIANIL